MNYNTCKYSEDIIKKWIVCYNKVLSVAEVARLFNVPPCTVNVRLKKYRSKGYFKFANEIQEELFLENKRICLPVTGCGEIKDLSEFSFRSDTSKYKGQCKACRSKIHKLWEEKNVEHCEEYSKKYFKENRKKISAQEKDRVHNDLDFKLRKRLRTRISSAIRGNKKVGSAVNDLGCTIPELRARFETLFKIGMTWDNYGEWHIDHIKPLSKFDLTDRDQLLEACHYTNLQPLWAAENIIKGNKQ